MLELKGVWGGKGMQEMCVCVFGFCWRCVWSLSNLCVFYLAVLLKPAADTLAMVCREPPQSGCNLRPPATNTTGLPELNKGLLPQSGCMHTDCIAVYVWTQVSVYGRGGCHCGAAAVFFSFFVVQVLFGCIHKCKLMLKVCKCGVVWRDTSPLKLK